MIDLSQNSFFDSNGGGGWRDRGTYWRKQYSATLVDQVRTTVAAVRARRREVRWAYQPEYVPDSDEGMDCDEDGLLVETEAEKMNNSLGIRAGYPTVRLRLRYLPGQATN